MWHTFWDYVLNLDAYLSQLVETMGAWVYAVVFAVIFAETGLVVTPWLPGESLLIASGSLAGSGYLSIYALMPLLFAAAFLGDVCNYLIGRFVGEKLTAKPRKYLRPEHVAQAHAFYEKWGGLAIVLARFMPVVRTLAPFTAGGARMGFHRFLLYAAVASALWVAIFAGAGFWFGSIPWVQDNLALMMLGIVLLSLVPTVIGVVIRRVRRRRDRRPPAVAGARQEAEDREDADRG